MDGFSSDSWSKLTIEERLEHCRLAAQEAERYASNASPDTRPLYKELAEQWQKLAAEMRREAQL